MDKIEATIRTFRVKSSNAPNKISNKDFNFLGGFLLEPKYFSLFYTLEAIIPLFLSESNFSNNAFSPKIK